MGLFNRKSKKNTKFRVELPVETEVEERVGSVERDMDYLEAQVRQFRLEQRGRRRELPQHPSY